MNLKHLVFLGVLAASIWALVVAGFSSIEDLQKVRLRSELPSQSVGNELANPVKNRLEAAISVLNVGVPLSLAGVTFLILCFKTERVGIFSLLFAIACFFFSTTRVLTMARTVSETNEVRLENRVWWM